MKYLHFLAFLLILGNATIAISSDDSGDEENYAKSGKMSAKSGYESNHNSLSKNDLEKKLKEITSGDNQHLLSFWEKVKNNIDLDNQKEIESKLYSLEDNNNNFDKMKRILRKALNEEN